MANSYNVNDLATVGQIQILTTRIVTRLIALESSKAFRKVTIRDNKLCFFESSDTSLNPIASVDLPEEIYLDQTGTEIVENFTFSNITYPGATDPNLNGKTVLVLAVRGNNANNLNTPTVKYSFVGLSNIFDDFVEKNRGATAGNFAIFGISGAIEDSNIGSDAIVTKINGATQNNVIVFDNNGAMSDSGIAASSIFTTIGGFSIGNIMTFDSDGKVTDSGHSIATDAAFEAMLDAAGLSAINS